jgi:serine/threonine-protein kinase RsbT
VTVLRSETLPLKTQDDVVIARQLVRKYTLEAGLGLVDQTKLVTATSELARNTIIYGGGGNFVVELVLNETKKGVRAIFEDKGPGIPDIELAMKEGYTTGAGLGLGLSGSKRLVNEFEITSKPGEGTRVTVVKWKM